MNVFKGLNHQVKVFQAKDGKGVRSRKEKRPEGMSGRQWTKLRKARRRQGLAECAEMRKQVNSYEEPKAAVA